MARNWKQLSLLAVLAFLQCFAPLLHAHADGVSATYGVHFHLLDSLTADEAALGQPVVKSSKEDYPAIGMAQEYKKDKDFLVLQSPVPLIARFPVTFPQESRCLPLSACLSPASSAVSYFLPPANAPPLVQI